MNVLEMCLSPSFGGLEIHMRDFSRWLSRRPDAQLHLALLQGSRIDQSLGDLGKPTIRFSRHGGAFPLLKARRLARYIDHHAIDAVHVHWKDDLPLAAFAKRMARRPVRLIHTRQMSLPGRKFDPYHHFVYSALDRFIAITRAIARQASANLPIPQDRILQIYYGVDVPRLDREAKSGLRRELGFEDQCLVGVVGRVTELKGQHLLIEAIDLLRQEGLRVGGIIMGEPFEAAYVKRLHALVRERDLADQIVFKAFHPRPYEILVGLDVLALTTRAETFGLVLIEAMQCGTAVIGSNAEGVPEIIDEGTTGLLFESGNAASLARAIGRLAGDVDLRDRLAMAGQRKARAEFDASRQYEKFYEALKDRP